MDSYSRNSNSDKAGLKEESPKKRNKKRKVKRKKNRKRKVQRKRKKRQRKKQQQKRANLAANMSQSMNAKRKKQLTEHLHLVRKYCKSIHCGLRYFLLGKGKVAISDPGEAMCPNGEKVKL